ncbi:alpha/beta fold hydrolase [Pyxidicoccus fallax]|uniref:Alpha/beta hydrolase n=1 Tax=Pyxidicoccus fallax TaxID=394095 RepID=A0A848LUN7_9BACT|nr:alpha/beta fold hydrolase [Pyxidicoccus fallax]NMO21695.1 alpha/beta hydrolase [Pyxidicoccus fallax]NPC82975.1 alpha/beta fold hydrolase [Pyxidicoccus fallax]
MTRFLLLALCFLSISVAHAARPPVPMEVQAEDGERIPVLVLEPEGDAANPPVAVLLHGLTRKKEDWLSDTEPTYGGGLTEHLLRSGYRVYLLDARLHGARANPDARPGALAKRANKGDTAPYQAMIVDTVRDARALLARVLAKSKPPRVLVAGYSMGAQVGLLVASREPRVTHLVTMVPPHVDPVLGDAAPVNRMGGIQQTWLLLTATRDQFSTEENNQALFKAAPSKRKTRKAFDSEHALPREYLDEVRRWLSEQR